jgi:phenylpropionate dioxygenase-like ring-hydroxylating dioxygenase large terminal subunit
MPQSNDAAAILAALAAEAGKPLQRARTAPPALYNAPAIFELEQERIFKRDWIAVGLAAEIPEAGDYLTYVIAGQPVVVIRGKDGVVRGLSNVCRHRLMVLLQGRGNAKRIVCPYHAWTYSPEGRLVGASQMERTEGFDQRDLGLPQLRTEVWNGWIYVTLNADAPPVAEVLAPMQPALEPYGMSGYVPIMQQDHVWQTNWKLVTENFTENYHGPFVHGSTVSVGVPMVETGFVEESYDAFSYSTFPRREAIRYGHAHPDNTRLQGKWRHTTILMKVFPTQLVSLAPDLLWYLLLQPRGIGEVAIRFGVALAPERYAATADLDALIADLTPFFDKVNGEDRAVVEGIYRGSLAPLAVSGPLSWLEREIHEFTQYLSRRLGGSNAG